MLGTKRWLGSNKAAVEQGSMQAGVVRDEAPIGLRNARKIVSFRDRRLLKFLELQFVEAGIAITAA